MKSVVYFIFCCISCSILAYFLSPKISADFVDTYMAVFGVLLIVVGIGGLIVLSELYITSISLIIFGIICSIYGINGGFGLFKEFFEWGFRIGY